MRKEVNSAENNSVEVIRPDKATTRQEQDDDDGDGGENFGLNWHNGS
jgi:hypothetical protein